MKLWCTFTYIHVQCGLLTVHTINGIIIVWQDNHWRFRYFHNVSKSSISHFLYTTKCLCSTWRNSIVVPRCLGKQCWWNESCIVGLLPTGAHQIDDSDVWQRLAMIRFTWKIFNTHLSRRQLQESHSFNGNRLALNVQGPSYLGLTMSISCLLMPWLLTSPGHQQPWYWICRKGRFLSYLRKDFKYLRRTNMENWHEM